MKEIYETDPGKNAKEYKAKGIAAGNPEHLRRAKNYYVSLNDQTEVDYCEAYALKIEGKLAQAGDLFYKIGKLEEARDCYWDGELWNSLLPLKGNINQEDIQLAEFMVSIKDEVGIILDFTAFIENCIENNKLGKSISKQWKSVLGEYRQRIFSLTSSTLTVENWQRLRNCD